MMVAKSNHALVNMADFGDDLEIEWDVLLANLLKTTTHPVVRVTERLEHRHRLRMILGVCAREAQTPGSLPQTKTTKKE